jgi:formylglycine-generating enzyme required for sulfatase activity
MEKTKARSALEKTTPLRKRNPWIAVGVIGLIVIFACAIPSPTLRTPSQNEGLTSVTATASATVAPTRTATLEPSSTPTWTGTEVIEATLTFLPDYSMDVKGVPMAYVPEGFFAMGNDLGSIDEQPIHPVNLDAFYIDKFEVTNGFYEACVEAAVCQPVKKKSSVTRSNYFDDPHYVRFPVIFVDWNMAQTYCETWREARLPTEAEWEKAARGRTNVIYPWGDTPDCNLANYGNCLGDTSGAMIYALGQSRYGVYNMAGNVWEWVSDWYSDDYYRSSPEDNPQGPDSGNEKVLRGGSWKDDYSEMRSVNRESEKPAYFSNVIGFRCAKDANP